MSWKLTKVTRAHDDVIGSLVQTTMPEPRWAWWASDVAKALLPEKVPKKLESSADSCPSENKDKTQKSLVL